MWDTYMYAKIFTFQWNKISIYQIRLDLLNHAIDGILQYYF